MENKQAFQCFFEQQPQAMIEHSKEFALFTQGQWRGYFSSEAQARLAAKDQGSEIFYVRRVQLQEHDQEIMLGQYY